MKNDRIKHETSVINKRRIWFAKFLSGSVGNHEFPVGEETDNSGRGAGGSNLLQSNVQIFFACKICKWHPCPITNIGQVSQKQNLGQALALIGSESLPNSQVKTVSPPPCFTLAHL